MWDIRERNLFTKHLRNFNAWNQSWKQIKGNKKKVTYETVPSCLSPKTTEMDGSTRTMNFFFLLQILHTTKKRTAGEKMHLKSSFKNKRSIIPYILHICYTIIHSDHKTKWQASQYSWLFVCFSTQYTTILISFHYF